MRFSRFGVCKDSHQGSFTKVLCVCSAGILRSPSIAFYLSNLPFGCNTRAVGTSLEYALIPIDDVLIEWADHLVFANNEDLKEANLKFGWRIAACAAPVWCLNLQDEFNYRDEKLMRAIEHQVEKCGLANVLLGGKLETAEPSAPVSPTKKEVRRFRR